MLAAFLVFALLGVGIGGLVVGSAVVARHRAQSGADLAALAAAARVPAGARAACLHAETVTAAVKVMLRDCRLVGLDVIVSVAAGTGLRIGRDAHATARAGPTARG